MPEISEAQKTMQQLNENWHAMQAKLAQRDEEIKKYGEETAELKAQIAVLVQKQGELEVKQNRHQIADQGRSLTDGDAEAQRQVKEAFMAFCRKGRGGLSPDEGKLLSVGDDSQGGVLAPREFVNEIIKDIVQISPIRTIAKVRTTSASSIEFPKRTGTPTASWTGETETRTASNSTYAMEELKPDEMTAVTPVTNQMLEDSAFNIASELQADMAEQFANAEGASFCVGNGVKKPEGFLNDSAGVTSYNNGHATQLSADAIVKLTFQVKTAYTRNAHFALNRNTLSEIYTLKAGNGQYLYRPNQDIQKPPTIQGFPYIEAPDMPDIASAAYPIAFGDFMQGYLIVDRLQIVVIRDDLTRAKEGFVEFVGRKRVGGQTVKPEALIKLKMA